MKPLKVGRACDGSGLIPVGAGFFLNAADEDNIIRLYRFTDASQPVKSYDLNSFLNTDLKKNGKHKEADIESAIRVGDRIYWIASHGNDSDGNREPSRHRIFATDVTGAGARTRLKPIGSPYTGLIEELTGIQSQVGSALRAARPKPHKQGGIDIEGLAATAAGALLIGFRSPLVDGKSIVVQLLNPGPVLVDGAAARFGDDLPIDLDGLSIRDITPTGRPNEYWILAGESGPGPRSALYTWTPGDAPRAVAISLPAGGGTPEGLMLHPRGTLYLSMDGGEQGSPRCKDLPVHERSFLLYELDLPDEAR